MKVKTAPDPLRVIERSVSTGSVDSQTSTVPVEPLRKAKKTTVKTSAACITDVHATDKKQKRIPKKKAKTPKRKHVRFDEQLDCRVDRTDGLFKEDLKVFWYSNHEIHNMKHLTLTGARKIVKKQAALEALERESTWLYALQTAYTGFCQAETVDAVQHIVYHAAAAAGQQQHPLVPVAATGLEKWAVQTMGRDRLQRRRDLWRCLGDLQKHLSERNADARDRAHEIHLASRAWSRPSRLFAHHVAQLWIMSESEISHKRSSHRHSKKKKPSKDNKSSRDNNVSKTTSSKEEKPEDKASKSNPRKDKISKDKSSLSSKSKHAKAKEHLRKESSRKANVQVQ